jgi:colanic acid/amylovoran biosynthesis protein
MGDVAMLQVAVARLRRLSGDEEIRVFTSDAAALARYCPDARPVMLPEQPAWCTDAYLAGRLYSWLPAVASARLGSLYVATACRMPLLRERLLRLRASLRAAEHQSLSAFLGAIEDSRVIVISGAGGIGDSFSAYSNLVLLALQCAQRRGIPAVMVGHGFGTLHSPGLRNKASAILPQVSRIALREERASKPLLASLGVAEHRVVTTGDDSVELAYDARGNHLGTALGVNLRIGRSTATSESDIAPVRNGLQRFASRVHVPLVPLPIARQRDLDAVVIRQLIDGLDDATEHEYDLDTPAKVISQVARCRVVLTGAYHAAVFALAQGVPVVCLMRSQYSVDRFLGLEAQFGCGCHAVSLDDADVVGRIADALTRAWNEAPLIRDRLAAAAVRQIVAGRAAYASLAALVHG